MMNRSVVVLIVMLTWFSISLHGQEQGIITTPETERMIEQLFWYPQEKIYVHTDRSYYIPSERIWFRAFLLDAASHMPLINSRYVYVELINPMGKVVKRVKIKPENNIYSGYLDLADDLPEGNYILRAYTQFMLNSGEELFFKKAIRIGSPFSAHILTHPDIEQKDGEISAVKLYFTDARTGERIKPEIFRYRIDQGILSSRTFNNNLEITIPFKKNKNKNYQVLYIEFNEYCQYLEIEAPNPLFDVSFHPEGGYPVIGKESRIAFKALKFNGLSEDVEGEVINNRGDTVLKFNSVHCGMGSFLLIPEKGQSYYAVCRNKQGKSLNFNIPEAREEARVLNISQRNDKLFVSVCQSASFPPEDSLYLFIHSRGIPQLMQHWENPEEFMVFNKKKFPTGIVHFLLMDKYKKVLSERLMFCLSGHLPETIIIPDKEKYMPREKVNLSIRTLCPDGKTSGGNLSVAVTDDKYMLPDSTYTIFTNLLLTSDLKGYIESPEFYFRKNNKKSEYALDLLMMTQGWRRYNIPEVLRGNIEKPKEMLELGQQISGYVKTIFREKPVQNSTISIIASSEEYFYIDTLFSDQKGYYCFNGFELPDNTSYYLRAVTPKGSERVRLFVDEDQYPATGERPPLFRDIHTHFYHHFLSDADHSYTIKNGVLMVQLREVIIAGMKKRKLPDFAVFASNSFDEEKIQEMGASSIKDVLRRVAGVMIEGNNIYIRGRVSIMGGSNPSGHSQPLLIVDNTYIEPMYSVGFDLDHIHIDNVARIDVFKGSGGSAIGASSGAIMITTKKGVDIQSNEYKQFNFQKINPLGYQLPAEFYSPKYETPDEKKVGNYDLRTTIYWKPDVILPANGEATISFYTADFPTDYSIVAEGVTEEGLPFREIKKITVK